MDTGPEGHLGYQGRPPAPQIDAVGGSNGGQKFQQIAQDAPADVLSIGLSTAFSSDQTPAIGNMAAQLFGQSNGAQQAGLLNQLMGARGPAVMAGLAGGALGKTMSPGQSQITPEQAGQLSQQEVQDVVNHADEGPPGVANQLGQFYFRHKGLVNTLGGIAASIVLVKMKDHLGGQ